MFKVSAIDATVSPELYKVKDLQNDDISQNFYKEQLIKTNPDFKDYFAVEKVLHIKNFRGKKYYLCKFLYYPPKFNQYIEEKDMKFGNKKK